jgi:soluble lytic murein transglycosylase-like protein
MQGDDIVSRGTKAFTLYRTSVGMTMGEGMRIPATLLCLLGVCVFADSAPSNILVLKTGQRIVYDELSKEGGTLFVRAGGQSLILDASEVDAAPVAAEPAAVTAANLANAPAHAVQLIVPNADRHNLRPELIQAVMEVESGYKVNARSRVGAIGLMQLMPQTARHLQVNAHDPVENVEGGARLLDMLVKKYEGRRNGLSLALAAYNAGSGAVDRFGGIPPYKETREYVVKVMRRYKQLIGEKR